MQALFVNTGVQHMKAADCYEFRKPLVIDEFELDPPKTGDAMVKIGANAICHSDVLLVRGDWGQAAHKKIIERRKTHWTET